MLTCTGTLVNDGTTLLYRATRDIAKTDEGRASRKLRKKIEMLFAISSASYASIGSDYEGRMVRVTKSHLAATQNLSKLAKLIPMPAPQPK